MQARRHLKLIVSELPARPAAEDASSDRVSVVQPVSATRLRWRRLLAHRRAAALWAAALVLSVVAVVVALGR
jgi:hypothetical protein